MQLFEEIEVVLKKHDKVMKQTAYGTFEIHDKPEPSVIIKKSGGTWVARYDGVDYLDISGMSDKEDIELCDFTNLKDDSWWKPISSITITDEIAKLRPAIIVAEDSDLCTLYGVSNNIAVLLTGTIDIKHIRLATTTDLTKQE